ncbi:MAG: small-conductance mechanosensitive ion channel, partial [Candidatus Berkelbacteria bacterium]|nr:small-conductance mechanosensitive ion channel [Candidatus Berkelbacteria bacterium]
MVLQDWTTAVSDSWTTIWERFINFLPNLIGAALIIVIGWLVGIIVSMIIDRLFRIIGLQTLFEKAKVEDILKKGNIEKDSTALLAGVAKWVIYLVAFIAAANTLKLPDVANFLNAILAYIPSAVAAGLILLIGLVVAHFLSNVVKGSLMAAGLAMADAVALIVRYSIIIFAFLAALAQLGLAQNMVSTLFIGVIAFLAIAGGLAFGLGGKDAAQDLIDKVRK